jgi:hypothetical protein
LPAAFDLGRGPEAREQSQQKAEQRGRVGGDRVGVDQLFDRERDLRVDDGPNGVVRDGSDQRVEQQSLLVVPGERRFRAFEQRFDNSRDPVEDSRRRRFGQRCRNEVNAQRAVLGRAAAGQLDPAKPAVGEFADDLSGVVEKGDISRRRP